VVVLGGPQLSRQPLLIAPVLIVLTVACAHQRPPGPPTPAAVNLDPPDQRAIFSITIGDAIEAALLQQQLGLEPLRVDGNTLYFYDTGGIRAKLATYGYTPTKQNPFAVYQRVVRVSKRGHEADLARFEITLINRERDYWVVRGSIGALRALSAAGYQLSPLGPNEPRPRRVRIYAPTPEDVQRINDLFVDIYAVSRDDKYQRGVVVTGAAFDDQIDALQREGFRVDVIDAPPKAGQP
jgi:hypothetical protein